MSSLKNYLPSCPIPERKIKLALYLLWYTKILIGSKNELRRMLGKLVGKVYAFFSNWLLGIDLPYNTVIGEGLMISHGVGLVVNPLTIIGKNVWLRQNTTIGNNLNSIEAPIIGNNVNIGAHVVIIGEITIGSNSTLGAGSVITKNVPPNCVVIGNPARVIKRNGIRTHEPL
jgi:putative colanic acid biosynthesis acetyltransferase WcaB